MADSPNLNSSDVLSITIKLEGTDVTGEIDVESIRVNKAVNRIARATVTIIDGNMPEKTFPVSDKDDFSPGKSIEIHAGYGGEVNQIFSGIIIKHGLQVDSNNCSRLILSCCDEAIKMTVARNNANFVVLQSGDEIKDSDVIAEIAGNYSGLTTDIEATETTLSSLVQYHASDWDFIVARAEANGMLVYAEDGNFAVKKPDFSSDPVLTVTYGTDIMDFSAEVDSRSQLASVTAVSWDSKTLSVVEETTAAETDSSDQGTKNGDLSSVINLSAYKLQSAVPLIRGNLSDWTNGQLTKSKLSLLRGHIRFQGNATPTLGCNIEALGVGERFSGKLFCSAIEHKIDSGSWSTEVEFGQSASWFTDANNVSAPKASGLLPAAEGLQIGIVKKLDEDPEGQYRVQVSIPLLQAQTEGIWARLLHPYASAGFGSFFIPEIGDEVVIAYFNNDPGFPVIIGSLYSQTNTSPEELTADNYIKTLITRSQLKLRFDDEKQIILIETPGGHSICMDDDQENIVIKDSNDNSIELNSSGISLSSPKDIVLTADGNIELTAMGNISAAATGDASVDGTNITVAATSALSTSGNASAEMTASGTTTIKGAMVMIN